MGYQMFWNILHQLVIQADDISDLLILAQIALSFVTFYFPEPAPCTFLLVVHLVAIHYLTELLQILPGFPVLKILCTLLCWIAKFKIASVYFGWFRTDFKSEPERLEWGVGPAGHFEWLTPLKEAKSRRVEGITVIKDHQARPDGLQKSAIGASGGIQSPMSRRMDLYEDRKERGNGLASVPTVDQDCSISTQGNGVGSTRMEGIGTSDWRRELLLGPTGHLEWMTRKYDDIRAGNLEKISQPSLLFGRTDQPLRDPARMNYDESYEERLRNGVRETVLSRAPEDRVRFPWDDLVKRKKAFT